MKLLDLYCGGGGSAVGWHRAGFDVTGVDVSPRSDYPFELVEAEAVTFLREHGTDFDVITGSPPCQAFSTITFSPDRHADLIGATREAMIGTGRPYVIENVPRAPLHDPILLCGSHFPLVAPDQDGSMVQLRRHRIFESNVALTAPGPCRHLPIRTAGVHGNKSKDPALPRGVRHGGEYVPNKVTRARLLGITWPMTLKETAQAIPPAYTEYLGRQIMRLLLTWLRG